jgi:hypothetical protein
MAKPIKETPVLTGRDATAFVKQNREIKKVSTSEKAEINKNYQALLKMSSFGA